MERQEEMKEDCAVGRDGEGASGAASDAEAGDECNEVTCVGGSGADAEVASMGSEGKVERGR